MKVLHVISSLDPQFGGPTVALLGLACAQAKIGLEVSVLARHDDDCAPVLAQLQRESVAVSVIPARFGFFSPPREVVRHIEMAVAGADILHLHGLWHELVHQAARLARRSQIPYIMRPCGMLDPWSLSQNRLRKRVYMMWKQRRDLEGAGALHFTSHTEHELTVPLQLKAATIVEPNGVNLDEFQTQPDCEALRRRYPAIGARKIVLFFSRLHPKKGLDLLIPAFAASGCQDSVLVIAGPDEDGYRAAVEALVREHNIEERVFFTGMLRGADRITALAGADLFVLPSYQENFGNAVVESLAAGTPVIVSDQVNIHTLLSQAGVGAAVPLAVEPLAQELKRWLSDATLRQNAAARARPFVQEQFDWQRIARRWEAHYSRLIAAK